jgi:hypothetical protein
MSEVYQDVGAADEIISPGAKAGSLLQGWTIEAWVANLELAFSHGNATRVLHVDVLVRFLVPVSLAASKIDEIQRLRVVSLAHADVFWLDISMHISSGMNSLQNGEQLQPHQHRCLLRKPSTACIPELVKIWPQQLHYQHIEVTLLTLPVYLRHTPESLQLLKAFSLMNQHRKQRVQPLHLYPNSHPQHLIPSFIKQTITT